MILKIIINKAKENSLKLISCIQSVWFQTGCALQKLIKKGLKYLINILKSKTAVQRLIQTAVFEATLEGFEPPTS